MGKLLRDETFQQAMNQKNALLQVLASDKVATVSGDWTAVQRIVRSGSAPYVYAAGDMFTDTWNDTAAKEGAGQEYTYPWHIADFGDYELEGGETFHGMTIQAHYAHPFGVQFSHQMAFLACPTGLEAGTYYFTIESTWGSNVTAGDTVSFTTTQAVPANGCVAGCYGAPNQAKSTWKIYTYAADRKTILETLTPTFEATGTSLGTQHKDTREGNLNSTQEMAYGHNRWKTSALRQYLNSSADKGAWWSLPEDSDPDYPFLIAPDQLTSKDGFLKGMPEDLLAVIKPTKIVTYQNTVQDGGTAETTYDKIFLPALEQIHVNPQISGEGTAWEYWKQVSGSASPLAQYGTYPQMITYAVENHSSALTVRLRSAHRGYATHTWSVTSTGIVSNGNASGAYRFAPACVIG